EQVAEPTGELDPHLLQQTLHLTVEPHPVPRPLGLHPRHGAPARCSESGTKLKINSPARNRRRNRTASRKSYFRPLGARLEKACARCKRMYGSNSIPTGFQYGAVDSRTTSVTPCSRSQPDKQRRSLVVVPKRRHGSSPCESTSLAPATTISTF